MTHLEEFLQQMTTDERALMESLDTPVKIQAFIDTCTYSSDPFYRCPLAVLRHRKAHCFDGALFGAAALRRIGHPPLLLEMLPNDRDDDHLLALYKIDNHWGSIAKSNFVGLRFREPIHRTLRELLMSYFEQYYNVAGEKTLRGYTAPMNLDALDHLHWMTRDEGLDDLANALDDVRRYPLISEKMVQHLARVDPRSLQAGLLGSVPEGLFQPQ